MSLYTDYLQQIESRKDQGLHPKPIEDAALVEELIAQIKDLQNENEIICYCAMGGRSLNAAMLLRDNGLFNATSMSGGITAWRNYGGQTEPYTES